MSNYIPLEIKLIILKRLPVKSLIRFRSVCKPWKSLINSSEFIRQWQQKHHLLVKYVDQEDDYNNNNNEKYVSIVDDDDDTFPRRKFFVTVPMSLKPTTIIGSSQGLVCIYDEFLITKSVVIWNPTIRKSVSIDVPNVLPDQDTTIGFGVCPRTSDPKLVKIINCPPQDIPCQQVEVFTLSSGFWRTPLSGNLPDKRIEVSHNEQVVIDRFIYWLGAKQYVTDLIMSFDMITEEFTEICLPDSLSHVGEDNIDCLSMSKLKESLVLIEYVYGDDNQLSFCKVWTMVLGVTKSFTKLYTN